MSLSNFERVYSGHVTWGSKHIRKEVRTLEKDDNPGKMIKHGFSSIGEKFCTRSYALRVTLSCLRRDAATGMRGTSRVCLS